MSARWAVMVALLTALQGAPAREAAPLAADPALEARVMHLAEELRCLVCQNQTIADSHSGLAMDLKQQIREQLRAGRSEAQVMDYMVERFGDFVRYRPPVKGTTRLLWFGPGALLVLAAAGLLLTWRRRRAAPPALADDDRARAAALLDGG